MYGGDKPYYGVYLGDKKIGEAATGRSLMIFIYHQAIRRCTKTSSVIKYQVNCLDLRLKILQPRVDPIIERKNKFLLINFYLAFTSV